MKGGRSAEEDVHVLACAVCPRVSSVTARGWKAYLMDDPWTDAEPTLAFYCPACARDTADVDDRTG
jgi:hypothetical protein